MASEVMHRLPQVRFVDLRGPDGTHSGARLDVQRGILEIHRRGSVYVFDLAKLLQPIENVEKVCYTEGIP